jgi:hypothetical protein
MSLPGLADYDSPDLVLIPEMVLSRRCRIDEHNVSTTIAISEMRIMGIDKCSGTGAKSTAFPLP